MYSDSVLLQDRLHIRIQLQESCLLRNLFHKFCLRRNISIKKSCLRHIFFHNFFFCYMPDFYESKCLVIFITVGKIQVFWAGQQSMNQLINVLPAAPFVS